MFGTVMTGRLRAGKTIDDMRALMGPNWADVSEHGGVWAEFGVSDQDSQVVLGVIHFRDRDSYYANANRSETNSQYEKMTALFESPPQWTDVSWVAMAGTPKQLSPV